MNNIEFNKVMYNLITFLRANKDTDKEVITCQSINESTTLKQIYRLFDSEQYISTEESRAKDLLFTFILLDNNQLLKIVETGISNSVNQKQLFFVLTPNANKFSVSNRNGLIKVFNEEGKSIHNGFNEVLTYPKELPKVSSFESILKPTSINQIIERQVARTRVRTENMQG